MMLQVGIRKNLFLINLWPLRIAKEAAKEIGESGNLLPDFIALMWWDKEQEKHAFFWVIPILFKIHEGLP